MSVKNRALEFINSRNMSVKQFEEKCNLSNGYISSMRKSFGSEKLDNVLNAFPELNRNWLLYGEGEMLNAMMPPIAKDRFKELATDAFATKLTELFQSGVICPGTLVAEKDQKINELYREIGRLEAIIKDLTEKLNKQAGE